MKKKFRPFLSSFLMLALMVALTISFTSCPGPNDPPGSVTDPITEMTGGVFKGPFLVGSTVTIYELDEKLNQTGVSYSGDIVSNDGTYDISGLSLIGPVELVANGYYYNELTGEITADQMTMRAITEATGTVNVNLFTALEYDRVKTLYAGGMKIADAKTQAVGELFTAFGLSGYQKDAGEISVESANGAELLIVSALMSYAYSNVATLQNAITSMRVDFADGVIDVSDLVANAKYIDPGTVKSNLSDYYASKDLTVSVPGFSDELWALFDTDSVTPDDGNYLALESADTVELIAGFGHLDGFILPDGHTLSFTINLDVSNNYVRFFETQDNPSFTCSDNKHATATGPGYFRLDFGIAYPTTPYEFTITVNDNGMERTINYQVVSQ